MNRENTVFLKMCTDWCLLARRHAHRSALDPNVSTSSAAATPAEGLPRDALVKLLSDLHGALGRLRGQLATAMARRRRITKVARPLSAEGQAGGGAAAGGGEAPARPPRRPATKTKRAKPRKKRALSDTESDDGDDWEW